jgi:hypothetical protein
MLRSPLALARIAAVLAGVAALATCRETLDLTDDLAAQSAAARAAQEEGRVLDERMHHLGDDRAPDWKEAPAEPEPSPLVVTFQSRANDREWMLEATARDVDDDWVLELNGRRLGLLKRRDRELGTTRFVVPAGAVADGRNVLTVTGRDPNEDITVGRFRLIERSLREVARLGRIEVTVRDAADGSPLPARVTVTDETGRLVDLYYAEARSTAVRPGITYTSDGAAAIEIPEGRYQVFASRGMEWSFARAEVAVAPGSRQPLSFSLAREVDTTGWIAADTHVHTLTYSGHGDSSVEERVVTLAGEGVELAVATDHNHQTDYRPVQEKLELTRWFTPVVGNEVTSDNGHMNAFPLPPGKDVPPFKVDDWATLVEGIRAKGAKVVILNHPRWPEKGKDPLTIFGFDERSGERRAPQRFTFDCLELVNSDAPTQPWERVLPAWYALLDRGEVFTGVGASDSHHVGVIVGQGRTYVPSATDDPARIDVEDACRQFRERRVTVSLGMLATIAVDGRGMGETVRANGGEVTARVEVRHPSWVSPERVDLVVNGTVAASAPLAPGAGSDPNRQRLDVSVKLPPHDAWLVAVATGGKVTAPFWAMAQPRAVAITNPIFLDRDGEPGWQSPRATAERIVAAIRMDGPNDPESVAGRLAERLSAELTHADDAVAIQALELARDELRRGAQSRLEELADAAGAERASLREWSKAQQDRR